MATIKISNLHPAGSELFKDSESFMTELVASELGSINGGTGIFSPLCVNPGTFSPLCKPLLPRLMLTPVPDI